MKDKRSKRKRVKVGTILDKETADFIRLQAAREGRTMSDVIMEAVAEYSVRKSTDDRRSEQALERLLSNRFSLSQEDWREILEEDFYDQ